MLATVYPERDPRGMQQRYLTFALFDREFGSPLSRSPSTVDTSALHAAIRAGLTNQDGRARSSIASIYRHLTLEQLEPLLWPIYTAVLEPAPSGEMFADQIRVEGLRLLAKHHIEEGIRACVLYTREQNPWASEKRTPELMQILLSYGAHAQAVLPELQQLAQYFAEQEQDFPRKLMQQKAECVRETMAKIKAATERPVLRKLPAK
jgi:hypothetical protein